MKKGFINIILLLGVAAAIALGAFAYKKAVEVSQPKVDKNLGATVYTTQLTDTLNTFRQQVNSSTANLNTDLVAAQATIATYGNIVTQNTPLAVNKGGTATTTSPTDGQFFSSVGTTPTWKTLASSTGITLTFTPTTTIIGTAGFDSTANIAFSGNDSFAATTTFNANTIFGSNLASTSQLLATDGNNAISSVGQGAVTGTLLQYYNGKWNGGLLKTFTTSSVAIAATTTYVNVNTTTFPIATKNSIYEFSLTYSGTLSGNTGVSSTIYILNGGVSTTLATCVETSGGQSTGGTIGGRIIMQNSTSGEIIWGNEGADQCNGTNSIGSLNTYQTINFASTTSLNVNVRPGGGTVTITSTSSIYMIQ